MRRHPARFTQADVTRALRAAERAGLAVSVDILPDGTIRLSRETAKPVPEPSLREGLVL